MNDSKDNNNSGRKEENRETMAPIPANLKKLLNQAQLLTIQRIGQFGWELQFVRRNGLEVPLPVVKGPTGEAIGVIDEDGNIDSNPDIVIRK